MESAPIILDQDARPNKPLFFPNGTLKKHHHPRTAPPQAADLLYRECLKNHAASLGGHALDGCGEFMPSPAVNPADPTSLKCAACGCHRNFHRRLLEPHQHADGDDQEGEDEMDDGDEDDQMEENNSGEGERDRQRQRSSSSPPPYFSSAPHMLLALSAGLPGAPAPGPVRPIPSTEAPGAAVGSTFAAASVLPRKRFRTKFSPEQKERMHELSERLGWRMQKREVGLLEECCREIGVGKGVFKVWMHNNKHNFVPGSSRRGEVGSSSSGGVGIGGGASGGIAIGGGGMEGSGSGEAGNSHGVNGSSSSS